MAKKLVFLINPNSGARIGRKVKTLTNLISRAFNEDPGVQYEIFETKNKEHTLDLAGRAAQEHAYAVIVSGGDGTINSVLPSIAGTNTALGIIPSGSGNGFARGLKIPLGYKASVEFLKTAQPKPVDLGIINGEYFVNMAGIGLDATVAQMFDAKAADIRGPIPYIILSAKEIATYEPINFKIANENKVRRVRALLMAFANGPQYGMGAAVAPKAQHGDGLINAVYFRKCNIANTVLSVASLFSGNADKFSRSFSFKNIKLVTERPVFYHVDGEPRTMQTAFEVSVKPGEIKVLV